MAFVGVYLGQIYTQITGVCRASSQNKSQADRLLTTTRCVYDLKLRPTPLPKIMADFVDTLITAESPNDSGLHLVGPLMVPLGECGQRRGRGLSETGRSWLSF